MEILTATISDLPEIIQLENEVWSKEQRCPPENFLERLKNFPQGFLVGRDNGELMATFYAIRRRHEPGEHINWERDSGYGTGSTHVADGNSLFSLSCTVSPRAPKGCYREMMTAWKELAKSLGVQYMYAGSRAVGLSSFNGPPEGYLAEVRSGKLFDPILSKAKVIGFTLGNLIPEYFEDPSSLNYGIEIFQVL